MMCYKYPIALHCCSLKDMTPPNSVVVIGMSWCTLFFDGFCMMSEYSCAAKPLLDRASFGEPSRRTCTPPTPASMRVAASSTRSPATSASSAASRSASRWGWPWTVSHRHTHHPQSSTRRSYGAQASGTGHKRGSPRLTTPPPHTLTTATRLARPWQCCTCRPKQSSPA